MGVNYGLNKLRFTSPVPIPSKVRVRATLAQVEEIKGGVQATFNLQFEVEAKTNRLAWRRPFIDTTHEKTAHSSWEKPQAISYEP